MKSQLKLILILLIVINGFSGGKKDSTPESAPPDTTKPVISLTDPISNKNFILGSTLHLLMDISDNVELKSYKVDIHKSLKGVVTSDWVYLITWVIPTGKKTYKIDHNEIVIPATITGKPVTIGNYVMVVSCMDLAGNEISTNITITLSN